MLFQLNSLKAAQQRAMLGALRLISGSFSAALRGSAGMLNCSLLVLSWRCSLLAVLSIRPSKHRAAPYSLSLGQVPASRWKLFIHISFHNGGLLELFGLKGSPSATLEGIFFFGMETSERAAD